MVQKALFEKRDWLPQGKGLGLHMLHAYSILHKEKQEAYSFVPENKELLDELAVAVDAVRHVEEICRQKASILPHVMSASIISSGMSLATPTIAEPC